MFHTYSGTYSGTCKYCYWFTMLVNSPISYTCFISTVSYNCSHVASLSTLCTVYVSICEYICTVCTVYSIIIMCMKYTERINEGVSIVKHKEDSLNERHPFEKKENSCHHLLRHICTSNSRLLRRPWLLMSRSTRKPNMSCIGNESLTQISDLLYACMHDGYNVNMMTLHWSIRSLQNPIRYRWVL